MQAANTQAMMLLNVNDSGKPLHVHNAYSVMAKAYIIITVKAMTSCH